jgi:hypothetical protein
MVACVWRSEEEFSKAYGGAHFNYICRRACAYCSDGSYPARSRSFQLDT